MITIATITPLHSNYHDDVWKALNEVAFCNEYTLVGWLMACGCQAKSFPESEEPGAEEAFEMGFVVNVTFAGPLSLLLHRLRQYTDYQKGEIGDGCPRVDESVRHERQIKICAMWLNLCCKPTEQVNEEIGNSYRLKHEVEKWAYHEKVVEGAYVADKALVDAARRLNIKTEPCDDCGYHYLAIDIRASDLKHPPLCYCVDCGKDIVSKMDGNVMVPGNYRRKEKVEAFYTVCKKCTRDNHEVWDAWHNLWEFEWLADSGVYKVHREGLIDSCQVSPAALHLVEETASYLQGSHPTKARIRIANPIYDEHDEDDPNAVG